MSEPYAKVIEDSISPDGIRLVTMEVRFHRFVLAEFNTHRVFSRNSASSRARPFRHVVAQIKDDPAMPLVWPAEQKGMQGGEPLADEDRSLSETFWLLARDNAVDSAHVLARMGLHKSLVNRLLEPWGWHTVVVTATDWDNFFEQRCSPLAQPEIRVAAEMMRDAMHTSTSTLIAEGDWHLPYIEEQDIEVALNSMSFDQAKAMLVKVSAGRCARVSYLTQDGRRDMAEDQKLYERLVSASPWHGSPLEHVATPWAENDVLRSDIFTDVDGVQVQVSRRTPKYGNLLGWRQLRLEAEAAQASPVPLPHF